MAKLKKSKPLPSLPKLKEKLQLVFNEFVRLRDLNRPCISCGSRGYLQAGHYFAVKGYDGLRFDEDNVNGECAACNYYNESHLIGYGDNLRVKIGEKRYNALKERAADYKKNGYKWSRIELMELIEKYSEKVRLMKKDL